MTYQRSPERQWRQRPRCCGASENFKSLARGYRAFHPASMAKESSLHTAIARLHDFRHGWEPGDVIDVESELTPEDLDIILAFLADISEDR